MIALFVARDYERPIDGLSAEKYSHVIILADYDLLLEIPAHINQ